MVFTKLNIWKFTEYNKLIYIDADTIVLNNIDELFKNDELSGINDRSEILNYNGINSGLLVIKPNLVTYNNLIAALNSDNYDLKMSDQSLINDYFTKHSKINYLNENYNRLNKKNK